MTFDTNKLTAKTGSQPGDQNFTTNLAVLAGHEGEHYADRGLNLAESQREFRAYENSAWAAQGVGFQSYNIGNDGRGVIWDQSWTAPDREYNPTANFAGGFIQGWDDKYSQRYPFVTPLDPRPND